MDIYEIRLANFKRLEDKHGRQRVMEKLNMDKSQASQLLTGLKNMGPGIARRIEKAFDLPHGWMDLRHIAEDRGQYKSLINSAPVVPWSGAEDLPESEFMELPRSRVKISAGNGKIVFEEDRHAQGQAFRIDWLKRRQLKSEHLICVYAEGDSMEEVIHDGDSVLIDTSQRDITDGKVYALRYGEECRIKRLYKRPDGGLIIRSDNAARYPEIQIPPAQMEHVAIIGRIVWHGGDM